MLIGFSRLHGAERDAIARQFEQAMSRFAGETLALQRAEMTREEFAQRRALHRTVLVDLVATGKGQPVDSLSPADLAALATACELLRQFDDAIIFGKAAFATSSPARDAFDPTFRSYVALKRSADAEALFETAVQIWPDDLSLQAFRMLLFRESCRQGRYREAILHADIYFCRVIEDGSKSDIELLLRSIEPVVKASQAAVDMAQPHQAGEFVAKLDAAINAQALSADDRTVADETANLVRLSRLCEVRCQFCRFSDPDQLPAEMVDWCQRIATSFISVPDDVRRLKEVERALDYVSACAYDAPTIEPLQTCCDALLTDMGTAMFKTSDKEWQTNLHRVIDRVVGLQGLLESCDRHKDIMTRPFSWDGVEWAKSSGAPDEGVTILYCCSALDKRAVRFLNGLWRADRRKKLVGVRVVVVCPYENLIWPKRSGRPIQLEQVEPEKERADISRFFDANRVLADIGFIEAGGDLATQLGIALMPQVMVIEGTERIRDIAAGPAAMDVERLLRVVQRLTK